MEQLLNRVTCGNTLDVLKTLPSESIDCCITSPPYWALRAYGTNPQIWDAKEGCQHEWGTERVLERQPQRDVNGGFAGGTTRGEQGYSKASGSDLNIGSFCRKCGAWRGELGLEPDLNIYIKHLCDIFDEVKRVLKKEGTCWVNLGDTYYTKSGSSFENDTICNRTNVENKGINKANELRGNGLLPEKCLCQIPSRFAIEMCNRGWVLRNEIIWYKRNCMPSSVRDRFTVDFEKIYFFTKNRHYYFEPQYEKWIDNRIEDIERAKNRMLRYHGKHDNGYDQANSRNDHLNRHATGQPIGNPDIGRNKRCVWDITTRGYLEAHFATFPEALIETPIKAGCPQFICKKCGTPRKNIKIKIGTKKVSPIGGIKHSEDENSNINKTYSGNSEQNVYRTELSDCGCNAGFKAGVAMDIFGGSGTTGVVAKKLGRDYLLIDLNPAYCEMARNRIAKIPARLDIFALNKPAPTIKS